MYDTLDYYNENAQMYIESTVSVEFHDTQDRFLKKLPEYAYILDFGCGSGRDTKYFLERQYQVDAIDGSIELCKYASEYTGIQVKHMLFQELNNSDIYDGIWACSSILHLSKEELKDVFSKMIAALKQNGVMYLSFKYGEFEGIRNGRYFIDFTENSFECFIEQFRELVIEGCWVTGDVRSGRESEKWLNLILRKVIDR